MHTLVKTFAVSLGMVVVLACNDAGITSAPDVGPVNSLTTLEVDPAAAGASHRGRFFRGFVPRGMVVTKSRNDFEDTYQSLLSALEANPAIGVVATLDHSANADRVGLLLPPTREIFFGNPNLGTPLMQSQQTTGLDLPQKLLIWQSGDDVFVGYNAPRYLKARHAIRGARDPLETIANALRNFASDATGNDRGRTTHGLGQVRRRPGLVFVESAHSADETFQRLVQAIDAAGPLTILFTLEHDQNAARVGLHLRPTKLIAFGNPALGTPLMQSRRTIGIDLPQKILVFEDADGAVSIVYNDPFFIAKRHKIRDRDDQLNTIAGALANLANGAAGN